MGVMQPQAEECCQPLEAGRGREQILSHGLHRWPVALILAQCADFGFLARIVRVNFYCFESPTL